MKIDYNDKLRQVKASPQEAYNVAHETILDILDDVQQIKEMENDIQLARAVDEFNELYDDLTNDPAIRNLKKYQRILDNSRKAFEALAKYRETLWGTRFKTGFFPRQEGDLCKVFILMYCWYIRKEMEQKNQEQMRAIIKRHEIENEQMEKLRAQMEARSGKLNEQYPRAIKELTKTIAPAPEQEEEEEQENDQDIPPARPQEEQEDVDNEQETEKEAQNEQENDKEGENMAENANELEDKPEMSIKAQKKAIIAEKAEIDERFEGKAQNAPQIEKKPRGRPRKVIAPDNKPESEYPH